MDALLIRQKVLTQKLEKSINNGKKTGLDRRTVGFYEQKIQELEKSWEEFDTNDTKLREAILLEKAKCEDDYILKDKYSELEIKFTEYIGELSDSLVEKRPPAETPVNSNAQSQTVIRTASNQPQLPRINLPKFNGEYDQWRSFHDLFVSLIHDNAQLKPVQKLHYLKGCLEGEAERLLKHIPVTGNDYQPAWDKLKQRYENKRLLVNTHLKLLVNQNKILNENSKSLKSLLDTTEECLEQLKMLNVEIKSWDTILIFTLVQKLPFITLRLWEEELGDSPDLPKYDDFKKFLQTRFRVLESVSHTVNSKPPVSTTKSYHVINAAKCPACNEGHYVGNCKKFLNMDVEKRKMCIKKSGRCFNCFSNKHGVTKCANTMGCRQCKGRHHSLLHEHKSTQNFKNIGTVVKNSNISGKTEHVPSTSQYNVKTEDKVARTEDTNFVKENSVNFLTVEHDNALLATAIVSIQDRHGRYVKLRCLVDPGSQSSFITEASCKRLGLHGNPTKVEVTGLNTNQTAWSNRQLETKLSSCNNNNKKVDVKMLVIKKITDLLPSTIVRMRQWQHLENLEMADPTYWKPGPIDILLGAKVYAEIIQGGVIKGPKEAPTAIETLFGWILLGNNIDAQNLKVNAFTITTNSVDELSQQLKQFWEVEEIPKDTILAPEDKKCEEYFQKTHVRLESGQYQVKLPFIEENWPVLGESRHLALKRFHFLERKFKANPHLEKEYSKCVNEYIELEHMEEVNNEYNCETGYHLPHHPVFKESTTTKLRVVFDASAKSSNGKSLNEQMLTGPTLQPKLFATLLKWRKYKIALTADIEKMYRMIQVHPEHRKFQKIIWNDPVSKETKDYQLKTVTFGTAAAPYLAIKTLKQLAIDEKDKWPAAAEATHTDFYVDDLLTGANTIEEAQLLQHEFINLLAAGGFNLRKWASNELEVLNKIPEEHREIKKIFQFDEQESIKTLGIRWFPNTDEFSFSTALKPNTKPLTKRVILSEVASLFDPLGWISPVIIVAKIILQALWVTGCSWDDRVNESIIQQWECFKDNLQHLTKIRIPRWVKLTQEASEVQIHGFCDASIRAYAAVIYLRVKDANGEITSTLLTSKTKVAPIKPITLPRLELCAAVMLAKLIKQTIFDMKLGDVRVTAWSDSSIALQWIKSHASKWKTFVANRVAEIQTVTSPSVWNHISTEQNPADVASRGCNAAQLVKNKTWWEGPNWLSKEQAEWPQSKVNFKETPLELKKNIVMTMFSKIDDTSWLSKFSSFTKLVRVTALIMRFINNVKSNGLKVTGTLIIDEIKLAESKIFQMVQQQSFHEEYGLLKKGHKIPNRSSLISLAAFIDNNGVMRVGGRLENAYLSYNRKHPIILPYDHQVTSLIIDQTHLYTLHGGVGLVLNTTRSTYWIINGKRAVARRINMCTKCIIQRKQTRSQIMGNLPAYRVNISKPFTHIGIDYAGPITLKTSPHRTQKTYKGYFSIFVCMSTKAIHLELVSDLTSTAFLAAFKRFVARRGLCSDVYSDCGSNFKGAQVILDADVKRAIKESTEQLAGYFVSNKVKWHFNPPSSPHFGGIWEAGVKSVKFHLRRIVGKNVYTYEEYTTLLTQVEACLNSRPLYVVGNSLDDREVLTPAHFLIGQPLKSIPETNIADIHVTGAQRWKHIQYMTQQFWSKWSKNYLNQLQQRTKWREPKQNIKVGDVVVIKEDNTPPTYWPLGKVTATFPGTDGHVRVAEVRTQTGLFRRPVAKLIELLSEVETESN